MATILLGLFAIGLYGQDLKSVEPVYHPGEQIHLVLVFDGPADLTGAGVAFRLTTLKEESQRLWTSSFGVGELKKVKERPNEYEVTGTIPAYAASGVYRLNSAWSNVADLSKSYAYPETLHQEITVRIVNDKKDPLPGLKEITLVNPVSSIVRTSRSQMPHHLHRIHPPLSIRAVATRDLRGFRARDWRQLR